MKPDIQRAVPADTRALATLARRTFAEAFGDEMHAEHLEQHLGEVLNDQAFDSWIAADTFFLIRAGSELVAYLQWGTVGDYYAPYSSDVDSAGMQVRRLYVRADYQGQRLGSALLNQALGEREAIGVPIYLNTWHTNVGARRLYERFGFRVIGEMPEYDANGRRNGHEWIMERARTST